MKFYEKFKPRGILSIYKVYPATQAWPFPTLELTFHEENLITLASKQQILSYIHTIGTTDPIDGLKVGTGGTIDPQGLFPKEEDQNWVDLNNPIASIGVAGIVPIGKVVDNSIPEVTYLADIDQSTANGSLINEAGLFKVSTEIFNVKTFPAIPKTSEFSLHFEWVIKLA
jgi:hypothetical protein